MAASIGPSAQADSPAPGAAASAASSVFAGFSKRDGGPAANAWLDVPGRTIVLPDGSVLINEAAKVRRVMPDNTIVTYAGTDIFNFFGDNGLAVNAGIVPGGMGLAQQPDGSVLIGDGNLSHRIRKVATNGTITTFAGSGAAGPSPCVGACGDGGTALAANLADPVDIEVGPGGVVYVLTNRVRRITTDGNINAYAGNGSQAYAGDGGQAVNAGINATGMTLDVSGNLIIADAANNRVRKVDVNTGLISTVAGTGVAGFAGDNGMATLAQLSRPVDVTRASDGSILVADADNHRIRRIDLGGQITTVAGAGGTDFDMDGDGGAATTANLGRMTSITGGPSGNTVYVSAGYVVRKLTIGGNINLFAGGSVGDGGPAPQATFSNDMRLATDTHSNVYIADRALNRVRKVTAGAISTVAGNGKEPGTLCVSCGEGSPATSVTIPDPMGVATDASGLVYMTIGNQVAQVTAGGNLHYVAGNGFGCCDDASPGAALSRSLNAPQGIAFDKDGNLYIADTGYSRVRKVTPGGQMSVFAGNGIQGYSGDNALAVNAQLNQPTDVAADRAGNVYIADGGTRVRKVAPNGVISTYAGTGTAGYSGDNGLGKDAQLSPADLDVDPQGQLLIADGFNNHIRRINHVTGIITTVWNVDGAFSVAAAPNGAVYAGERNLRRVIRIDGIAHPASVPTDFDGNGATDVAVFRPSNGVWYVQGGATVGWGTTGDIPVPGDYDGSGSTDIAVFRPSTGSWFVQGGASLGWGTSTDIPVPGDYDGNGTTDISVFRPSNGVWYDQGGLTVGWGTSGDIPVPGDYDANGMTDIAVFRPSTGAWYVRNGISTGWGANGDIPVPGDYDGNGTTDIAVFRPSNGVWYVQGGATVAWGTSGDIPVPGDYDGNGTTDIAVFRPSTGVWYIRNGATVGWGDSNDIPLPLPNAIRRFIP